MDKTELFEDFFLQNGFAPMISIPTHERHNCQSSCIDNILTNSCESVLLSGTLPENKLGDHSLIFEIPKIELPKAKESQKHFQLYEFSNSNLNKFIEELHTNISHIEPSANFSEFTDLFSKTLDDTCKLEKPKETKRTPLNNPWITDGIIAAVDKKHALRKDWTDSITDESRSGDTILHEKFRDYRRLLKYIINTAKNSYKCNKILENKEDSKKNLATY